jgi:hypothetical protein
MRVLNKLFFLMVLIVSVVAFARGNCQCPDQVDRAGRRCGRRSAFCRPGGETPACGTSTEKERSELFRKSC